MTERDAVVETRSDIQVDQVQHVGSDEMIARAARVSTGRDLIDGQKIEGLINYLVKNRHTSPLEHTSATFRIEAPIFVSREAVRHRTFSYNEISGRYADLPQTFYVPSPDRPLVNDGNGANPRLVPGTPEQYAQVVASFERSYGVQIEEYDKMRDIGIASEVARDIFGTGQYSAWYMTGNLHAWMNFLDLRTAPNALWEIREVGYQVEDILTYLFPITMTAWRTHHGDPSNSSR